MANKYFWLKLDRNFFKRHDVKIVEHMTNGKDYVLFYLKLLLESISHDGALRFSEAIPYDAEMLAIVTDTNVDTVKSAIKVFCELNLMSLWDDGTIFMNEVKNMTGSETEWAKKKRLYREKQEEVPMLENSPTDNVQKCPTEKEKELEKEKDNKYTLLDLKKDIFEKWNELAANEKAIVKHKTRTNAMDKAIERANTSLKFKDHKDFIELVERFIFCYKASGNMKPRTLTEFFGQRAYQKDWLICEEYTDEGNLWLYYKNKDAVVDVTVEDKNAKIEAARKAAGL